ncbi:MAG TPA: TonB family protein [Bryobacteraceae bacterium]|nr:TonB family protein [Bryobacteraceae bacterium]
MTPRIDILDERESLRGPFIQSVLLHVAIAGALVVSTVSFQRSREVWGSAMTQAGDAVPVTAVKTIPLPSRTGPVNPVANDTESQVPQPPKVQPKKQVKVPEEKAIPLLKKKLHVDTRPLEDTSSQRYRSQPPLPNQVFSQQPPAAVSPMFEKPGSGGVGIGQSGSLGTRFGAYADLVAQRVSDKWQTGGLAGLHTAPVVVVTFDIQKDGSIRNAKVAQHSGNDTLDYSALRAVTDAAPFPPLPAGFDRSEANVELRFQLQR